MTEQQPKMVKARAFFMDGDVIEGELSLTYLEFKDCAVPMVRIREQDGRQYLIPLFNIKCIQPLEGFPEHIEPVEGFEE